MREDGLTAGITTLSARQAQARWRVLLACSLLALTLLATIAVPGIAVAANKIHITGARIGCLDIQHSNNLTNLVRRHCENRRTCSYKAPTPQQYQHAGVHAATRTFCSQAMEITYTCGDHHPRTAFVRGDAWGQPPAQLACNAPARPAPHHPAARSGINVDEARIGCLRVQPPGNLTRIVKGVCDGRQSCDFQAPTPTAYHREGVHAETRKLCTQAMEIKYHCSDNPTTKTAMVPGDAWGHPPAHLMCGQSTVANNEQNVSLTPNHQCTSSHGTHCSHCPPLGRPDYIVAPKDMLDWRPTAVKGIGVGTKVIGGFNLPHTATPNMYSVRETTVTGSPGSVLGANEGRVRHELREAARQKDPMADLCKAAHSFAGHPPPASRSAGGNPAPGQWGNAYADLAVTGKAAFAKFTRLHPNLASVRAHCAGVSTANIQQALNRAYSVARALRRPHSSAARQRLGWIAVSGEDDQPYRPVDVPSTNYPQYDLMVNVPFVDAHNRHTHMLVHTRYSIAPKVPLVHASRSTLVDGGTPALRVPADPAPALANDAKVILFIHGMDSRLEESDTLTEALHRLPGNWTVIAMDLPTSGYADNIDPERIAPATAVACHYTPVLDFLDSFVIQFVNTLDTKMHGQLKPRIKAVVGGSLGGNLVMRLGRKPGLPWIKHLVAWSPASIWTSYVGQPHSFMRGCDTGFNALKDTAVKTGLGWAGKDSNFLPSHESLAQGLGLRREWFYAGFDWNGGVGTAVTFPYNHKPQSACWFSDRWPCKKAKILGARLDRQETYDPNFRAWHWRLGTEQLIFSQQQLKPGTHTPLYLLNTKPMALFSGSDDACGHLYDNARDVAPKMTRTPGFARFLQRTGHSLDDEHPNYVAQQIAHFVQ